MLEVILAALTVYYLVTFMAWLVEEHIWVLPMLGLLVWVALLRLTRQKDS